VDTSRIPTVTSLLGRTLLENGQRLIEIWNEYAIAGCENIYRVRINKDHQKKLGELFLPSNDGIYLDAGCGTGNMFRLIAQEIRPAELHAVDWSEEMLKKAKLEARKVQQNSKTNFKFYRADISKFLDHSGNFFDGAISNLLICYVTCGWKELVRELSKAIKPGGYFYLGTLLKKWNFTSVLWKHGPQEFLRAPVESLRGLRYRRIIARISKELGKHGAIFPSQQELIDYLKSLGFGEIKVIPTYWESGLVLRARSYKSPS